MSIGEFDAFHQRRQALEDAFFHQRDQQLLDKLKGELSAFEEKNKLAHVSGILEEKVLLDLVQAGVRAESLLAMRLLPLVLVAWADGKIATEEREAIMKAAAADDLAAGSAAYLILESWLDGQPDERVTTAWKAYVTESSKHLAQESVAALKNKMLSRCRSVAKAAGGYLGYGAISPSEQKTIDEIEAAYGGG